MRDRALRIASLLVAALMLGACNNVNGYCTYQAAYALDVTVTDSATGAYGPFQNLIIVAKTTGYKDSVFVGNVPTMPDSIVHQLGYQQSGTYSLTVTADGYRPWSRGSIFVIQQPCRVSETPELVKLVAK